jgi:hypothetical protein
MMVPDEIGERRQVNHTPTIALSIAAILLLIVGALSYRDFVRTSLEKEFAEKEARLMQRQGYYGTIAPGQQPSMQGVPAQQTYMQNGVVVDAQGRPVNQQGTVPAQAPVGFQPSNAQYDAEGNPIAAAPAMPPGYRESGTLPLPNDPELNNIRASLDRAREQSQLTEQRYNQLAGSVNTQAREAAAIATDQTTAGSTAITSELPDFLRDAVENPPGGNPEIEARLNRMRTQVAAAPSLGKVTSYDKDWGVVTFDAGIGQGVKVDQRFAVRRGSDILGWIKVDEVQDDQSIAVLVTKNRESDTSSKPEVGDDLIDFELF